MKHKKLSLKWKIFAYLLGLSVILLAVLWLCETVYLESFYKYIKEQDLKESVELLTKAVKEENPAEVIQQIAEEKELCVKVVSSEGEELYSEQFIPVSAIHNLTKEQLQMYYQEVKRNGGIIEYNSDDELKKGGKYRETSPKDISQKEEQKEANPDQSNQDDPQPNRRLPEQMEREWAAVPDVSGQGAGHTWITPPEIMERPIEEHLLKSMRGGQESMVCAGIVTVQEEEALLLVMIKLTPVGATIQTIRILLAYISVIIIILSLLLALLISRSVSKSIIKVNESARELAKGNFDVAFDGRDYREIGQLSDTLNYAAAELAKTENLQRELLANVSHDLRTPLTMIIAYSEVMRDLPGENTPENVQVVIEEAQRLTNLVNDMLDISKLQAGVLNISKRTYDLTDSINRVMERYSKLKEQEHYQIQFLFEEHAKVCADEEKIFQVLYNLINNAVNYTGEDRKVVVKQIVKQNTVRIEVSDTGEGIPEHELENVWERYYKVDKVHKRAIQGTGLGLSICKNILKLHGACYGADSKAGVGSTFWFELSQSQDPE